MRSLRARLFAVWGLSLLASLAVGVLLVRLQGQSTSAQVGREGDTLAEACDMIGDAYSYYVSGWSGPVPADDDPGYRRDLATVVSVALAPLAGTAGRVSGGIWQVRAGGGEKLAGDPPPAADFAAVLAGVSDDEQPALRKTRRDGETLLVAACPLRGPQRGLVAWTAGRVLAAPGGQELWLGLGVLLVLMLAISGWLGWLVSAWSRHVRDIEAALSNHARAHAGEQAGAILPRLPPTGERELDRIIAALNLATDRLAAAQAHAAALSGRVAAAERMAALGRVAAGVAHEIRNPIAAMRLKAENALAGDDARRRTALAAILQQVARLDRLLGELLAMTQRRAAAPHCVMLDGFLRQAASEQPEGAERIEVAAAALPVQLDPALVRRVLDNLLRNAVQHAGPSGHVRLSGRLADGVLRIAVRDDGPGVDPALRETLFEPFVTGRADGTGLGLAIAREFAEAHGGRLTLCAAEGPGATFLLELPQAGACRPS
jgi:signal transduction histidine kinase